MKILSVSVQPSRNEEGVVYFSPKKESLVENLMNRRARPYDEFKENLDKVIDKVMSKSKEFRQRPKVSDFHWSQKAGCKCGCSPGFKVTGVEGPLRSNIFVTYDL